jgi:hypothetical protein
MKSIKYNQINQMSDFIKVAKVAREHRYMPDTPDLS